MEKLSLLLQRVFLGLLLWCFCQPLLFAQVSQLDSDKLNEDLHSIYKEKYSIKEDGFYREGEFLIIITSANLPKVKTNSSMNRVKASCMLKTADLLKSYIIKTYNPKFKELPESSILHKHPEFKQFASAYMPEILEMPLKVSASGIQLENHISPQKQKYVNAYLEKKISSGIPKSFDWPSNKDLISKSRLFMGSLKDIDSQNNTHENVYSLLSSYTDSLIHSVNDLSRDYDLSNDWHQRVTHPSELFNRLNSVERMFSANKDYAVDNFHEVFNPLPFYPKSTEKLIELLLGQNQPEHAFILNLIDHSNNEEKMSVEEHGRGKTTSSKDELLQLQSLNLKDQLPSYLDFPIFRNNLRSNGFAPIHKSFSSNEPDEFSKATALFSQGGDLGDIQDLLISAVKKSPRHSNSWNLLGRTLSLNGFQNLAVVCYHQSLILGSSAVARANLSDAYFKLGFLNLSKGMALSTLLQPDCGDWESDVVSEILDISL